MNPQPPPRLRRRLAALASVSRATVERLIVRGEIHVVRWGRIRRIDREELDRLIAEGGVGRVGGRLERLTVPAAELGATK